MRISTLLKGLKGRAKKLATDSVDRFTNVKGQSSKIVTDIKEYNYVEPAKKVGQGFFKIRRKFINFYKRPFRDISHLSIILVIALTLMAGLAGSFATKDQVKVNPFEAQSVSKQMYLSSAEKKILEADTVATAASVYSDQLAQDSYQVTDALYKKASVTTGESKYLASMPILSTSTDGAVRNTVTKYAVQDGDTLSQIAIKFNITTDTIRYANQIEDVDNLKPGQELTILPATGVLHTVTSGQTIASIAGRYGISEALIISQNDLYGEDVKPGMQLMIPDAEIPEAPKPVPAPTTQYASNSYSSPGISYVASSSGPNHFPYGWCTWWVAQKRYVPWSGNAWQWYGNAQAYGRSVGRTPVAGAIMVTWESGYGHVAYVESASGNNFTISEMNYTGFGRVSTRTISTSSVPLIGFIY